MADDEESTSNSGNEDNPSSSENEDSASMADTLSDPISSSAAGADGDYSRSPKRHKRGNEEEVSVEVAETREVRISQLPESVLRRILSFVPIKIAVRTSIFGKRWKNLWTSAPIIVLDDSLRPNRQNPVNETAFMNFVDNVLNLHDGESPIENFSLECKQRYDPWRIKSWLFAIAELNVKDLKLTFPFSHILDRLQQDCQVNILPSSFFNRAHLVKLNLSHIMFIVPNTVNFPSLKTLWLIRVQLLGEDSMMNLLSGCPVLWMLDVKIAFWDFIKTNIRSSTLAYLSVHVDACPRRENKHRVVVEAPNIKLLHLSGNLEYDYDFGDLSSLKALLFEAEKDGLVSPIICEKDGPVAPDTCENDGLVTPDTCEKEDDEDSRNACTLNNRLIELLEKMSHVKELYFYACVVRFLEYASFDNFPMFRNLTSLSVDIAGNSWRILPPLLECSPNLVTLTSTKVFEGASTPDLEGFGWYPPPSVPKCLLSSLGIIEFKGFEHYNDEIAMIEYFLKNAMVLKKISIKSKNLDLETQSFVLKEILMFPRSSNKCGVVFS